MPSILHLDRAVAWIFGRRSCANLVLHGDSIQNNDPDATQFDEKCFSRPAVMCGGTKTAMRWVFVFNNRSDGSADNRIWEVDATKNRS
mmetsp:Transcript_53747/g.60035  ORF Transcript_53747/g.60035 Transcript_53747/m.60035 type:complete len:88 (-) Transcript_53747:270-533(-)